MKPLSIARLSFLFVLTTSLLVAGLGLYFWLEIERTRAEIVDNERAAARQEGREALATVVQRIRNSAANIAEWEETRQQLYFPDYYALWRDDRIKDAGFMNGGLRAVALYDRHGEVLNHAVGEDPMPMALPGHPPFTLYRQGQELGVLYHFLPIHADPAGKTLLGYLGLKFDLARELRHKHTYRFADLSRVRVNLKDNAVTDLDKLGQAIEFAPASNIELQKFQSLFQSTMLRLSFVVLATLFIASFLLSFLVVRPLRRLSARIDTFRDHDHAGNTPLPASLPLPVLELENLRRSFDEYHARLSELHDNLERSNRSFYDQARQDALTGVHNRRAFEEDWAARDEGGGLGQVALLLFDCDHFKAINDTYGHNVGDAVIHAIAQCLQSALRADDRLYRLGGDEFATLLVDTDAHIAETVAERCLEHILAHDFRQYGMSEPVTVSIGLALSDKEKLCLGELQKRADLAMYTAKRPGNRKIIAYSQDMGGISALVGNREITAVFQAIQDPGAIEIHYQKVARLPSLTPEYSEALTRVRDGDSLLPPGAIFSIVQARNLDAEFDHAVLRAVANDLAAGRLPPDMGVSINISAPGIVHTKVLEAALDLVRAHRGRKIVVEITETALITQIETASAHILRLREAGALVALDDFGSGYSSLRYLASMPVNLVKFDISMIHMLESGDDRQRRMIREIAGLVLGAGYEMVAEGVESQNQLDLVIELGFTHAQGYFLGRPAFPEAAVSGSDAPVSPGS